MSHEFKDVTAIVFKQFQVKWQEIGKSAVQAGIATIVTIAYVWVDESRFPTSPELLKALKLGAIAMIGFVIRYWVKPTTTVIKGQVEPKIKMPDEDTVISKDVAPDPK